MDQNQRIEELEREVAFLRKNIRPSCKNCLGKGRIICRTYPGPTPSGYDYVGGSHWERCWKCDGSGVER